MTPVEATSTWAGFKPRPRAVSRVDQTAAAQPLGAGAGIGAAGIHNNRPGVFGLF